MATSSTFVQLGCGIQDLLFKERKSIGDLQIRLCNKAFKKAVESPHCSSRKSHSIRIDRLVIYSLYSNGPRYTLMSMLPLSDGTLSLDVHGL